jgi:hypothetical protein
MVIDSARSANKCSWMSLCSVAVPASTEPTSRGSKSESICIADNAALR